MFLFFSPAVPKELRGRAAAPDQAETALDPGRSNGRCQTKIVHQIRVGYARSQWQACSLGEEKL